MGETVTGPCLFAIGGALIVGAGAGWTYSQWKDRR